MKTENGMRLLEPWDVCGCVCGGGCGGVWWGIPVNSDEGLLLAYPKFTSIISLGASFALEGVLAILQKVCVNKTLTPLFW